MNKKIIIECTSSKCPQKSNKIKFLLQGKKTQIRFFFEIVLSFREKRHFRCNLLTQLASPNWLKIDHFHSIRISQLLSAENL